MKKLLTVAAIALSSVAVYNTAIAQGFNDGQQAQSPNKVLSMKASL